jgi:hypothetical protein
MIRRAFRPLIFAIASFATAPAHAAGSNMPWEQSLKMIGYPSPYSSKYSYQQHRRVASLLPASQ